MSLVDLNPAGLNLASLKPAFAAQDERAVAQTQQQLAQVQLTNAQDEQQRNNAFRVQQAIVAKAPSVEAYTQLLAVAPREYVEGLKASISQMDAAAKKTLEAQILPAWLAGSNGRPELLKEELGKLADGYDSKGMKDKAAGIRDLLAKGASDPDTITAKLGATLLGAVGPERFKALMDANNMNSERRRKLAEATAAEANADPDYILGKKREQLAKAKNEEAQADNAKVREAARARAQVLEADIKDIEKYYKKDDLVSGIEGKKAKAFQDRASGRHLNQLTSEAQLTQGDRVAKAAADNRIAQAGAATAEAGATPAAIAAKQEQEAAQTKNLKAQASAAEAAAKSLPAHVGDVVREGAKAARESMAAAVRARTVADGYRRIAAAGTGDTGTIGRLKAWAREVAGTENKRDELNQLASRVLNSEVIDLAQKIRPVSDTDMAILRKGLPDTRGNPELVRDFMDALARVQGKQASVQIDSVAWEAKFRGPNDADKNTSINGVNVKAGESYDGFLRRAAEVREAKDLARNPKTDPALAAKIRARLKADGEDI